MAWWGAWRSRFSSSSTERRRGGDDDGDSGRHPHPSQRPRQPELADYIYIYTNYGITRTTTAAASGTYTTVSNTTYKTTTTTTTTTSTSSSVSALAVRAFHFPMPPNTSTLVVEEEDLVEVGHETVVTEQDKAKTREHVRDLIHGLGVAASIDSTSSGVLDRWLWELQVSWVLHLAQLDASAGRAFVSRRLQHTARSWVIALHVISRAIVSFTGWRHSQEEEEEEEEEEEGALLTWPPTSELVGFFAVTFSQMLPFVDVVAALKIIDPSSSDDDHLIVSGNGGGVASSHKFQALIEIRDALAASIEHVQLWDSWLCSSIPLYAAETTTTASGEMCSLLLAKLDWLVEAIWNTRHYIRTQFMSLTRDEHDSTGRSGLDLSPGIHKATKSALSYIIVLSTSHKHNRSVRDHPTVHEVAASLHVRSKGTQAAATDENTNLVMAMISSLEEKLTRMSQSFLNQSLRFLFLANNFHFVWHQLRTNRHLMDVPVYALTLKIDGYINSYMQVSWTPVLQSLHDRTPCCFIGYNSAQHKFHTMFEKTYAAQKLWKVPDPELREELRAAIIKKVIPTFTKFLEDNVVSASRVTVTPKELEEMLEELFEG